MCKFIKKILSYVMAVICIIGLSGVACAAGGNLDPGDIGDYGVWTTEHNREVLIQNISHDVKEFQTQYERDYIETGVPIEAKLGIMFIKALSYVSEILNLSLVNFAIIFVIVAFVFWIMFQSYKIMTDKKTEIKPTVRKFVVRGITLGIWLIVLGAGLPRLFGMIMGPIMAFGSYISNFILDAAAANGGFALSDTCAAIHAYATQHMTNTSVITADFAADIICVPARLSGFYYGAIKYGWEILLSGIGTSTFSFLTGLILVFIFTFTAFKFMFTSFGVIADLFLVVILLPFTAIAETINKTDYEGIAGKIYNGFLGIFDLGSFSLSNQIKKFVDAAIYFVALAIAIAIGGALLANGFQFDPVTHIVRIVDGDRMTMLLIGALVAYIATHVGDIAQLIGGAIEYTLGTELSKDAKNFYNGTKKKIEEIIKNLKKS